MAGSSAALQISAPGNGRRRLPTPTNLDDGIFPGDDRQLSCPCRSARPGRFELPTFGSVGEPDGFAAVSSPLQPVGIVEVTKRCRVHRSHRFAPNRSRLVTSLLQAAVFPKGLGASDTETDGQGFDGGAGPRFLTVKEAAAILRVCAATVYSMVERGELPHARVSNGIRIVVEPPRGNRGGAEQ